MKKETKVIFSTNILFFLIILFGLVLSSQIDIVYGQNEFPSDDEVNVIAKELYCPVCENIPLDVCPTQACAQWRALIKEKLVDGWTREQIKQYFVDQYGDRVLAQPPARGLNWLVYILPPLFFVGGIVLVYKNLKNIKKSPKNIIQDRNTEDDKYIREMEEALKNLNNDEDLS
jgi:cytochrome c-type biogenesis protein CcmH